MEAGAADFRFRSLQFRVVLPKTDYMMPFSTLNAETLPRLVAGDVVVFNVGLHMHEFSSQFVFHHMNSLMPAIREAVVSE